MFGLDDSDDNDEPRDDAHERDRDELPWGYADSIDVDLDDAPGAPTRSKRVGPKTSLDESLPDGGPEVPDELEGCFSAFELNDERLVVYDCENPDGWVASTRQVEINR
jgi:hypothetical protein